MQLLFDGLITLISILFLSIVGAVATLAIPGLFLVVVAPWLDRLLPVRKRS